MPSPDAVSPVSSQPWIAHGSARFTGRMDVRSQMHQWNFYFYLGRLLFVTGGIHPSRRWHRQYTRHCPHLPFDQLRSLVSESEHWEYLLLCTLLKQDRITREQAIAIVRDTVGEVLVDMAQYPGLTYHSVAQEVPEVQLALISTGEVTELIRRCRDTWQKTSIAGVPYLSMNLAPLLRQPAQLQALTSPAVYRVLESLLDGQRTLKDLSSHIKQDVFAVLRSLASHIETGTVELVPLDDLPMPTRVLQHLVSRPLPPRAATPRPLVACVDDSVSTCQTMERLVVQAGYRFVGIQDSLRAMPILIQSRPELIFLDLVMPNTNGYEVCTQLRKVTMFKQTPIIILTGNDGIIDRIRAKVVGSNDFMGKPIEPGRLVATLRRHLPGAVVALELP